MEDWIARATNSAKDHTQKDAAVAKDALTCNRWIASSALQKAIRRGETAIALRAAFALHPEDRSATWRRLIAIAFEDVGPADLDVIMQTVAVATLPRWRTVIGEEAVLRSIVSTLATAPKDRSADYLMWIATEHPDLRETREICGHSSITECLSMVLDHSRSLPDRAVAAWFCSGINYPYEHRVSGGDLGALADAYYRLGAPPDLVAATVLAARRTRQPYAVLVPLVWLEVQCSGVSRIEDAIVPPSGLVAGIPLYALDEHTRLGKRANGMIRSGVGTRVGMFAMDALQKDIAANKSKRRSVLTDGYGRGSETGALNRPGFRCNDAVDFTARRTS